MKRTPLDFLIGTGGIVSVITLKEWLAIAIALSTLILIWVRIWIAIRNRDRKSKEEL